MKQSLLALSLGTLALMGCTGETDPSKTNVFESAAGLMSGEFDRQIAEQEAIAAQIAADNRATEAENRRLDSQRQANASTIASLKSEIRDVRSLINATRSQISGSPEKIARLDGYQAQLAAVERTVDEGGSSSALRSELSSIRAAVRALAS
ncbi:MAG: hypothetical protein AAFR93_06595 [Pseudomonadota bacterium]